MLDLSRYLLGVAEILLLGGFAWLGASAIRARLAPSLAGAPAHLATVVVALALLILTAELLGSFGLLKPALYIAAVAAAGVLCQALLPRGGPRWSALLARRSLFRRAPSARGETHPANRAASAVRSTPATGLAGQALTVIAAAVAAAALVKFGVDVRSKLTTGMTGFDSTWYHGPFAAGFFQSGDTWGLQLIAPQFLAWFYPANAEIFHAAGMLAFGRDVLSPLLNLGWFVGCLLACWCIGRPYRVAPWSLALGAVALSLPVLADQAGEARNDIVGTFFLLAAIAIALDAQKGARGGRSSPGPESDDGSRARDPEPDAAAAAWVRGVGPLIVAGLAAGLAAGTKLNFALPAAVLVLGLPLLAPAGARLRAFAATVLAALAGGGYWYLRNLVHTGNPLPWFDHLGPISLPAPEQALGGREGHTVLSYLTNGSVWSDWFLPGLHGGLTLLWPLIVALALAGLLLCLAGRGRDAVLMLAGLTGLAVVLAWLIAPTSASGPEGMPRGFESGLRYLAPALVLGLALLPIVPLTRFRRAGTRRSPNGRMPKAVGQLAHRLPGRGAFRADPLTAPVLLLLAVVLAIAIGYPIQRHYLRDRYANPTFAAPGLNAAFAWANDLSNVRIATTGTRQYPLFGRDLTNRVQFVGVKQPHGGFTAPATCRRWRRLLNAGGYDYVVASRDRVEPGRPPYPPSAAWTEGPGAIAILRKPPTVVFRLTGVLDPSGCG